MLDKKLTYKEKVIATEDFIKDLQKLTKKDKEKVFYMIRGHQLLCKGQEDKRKVVMK